MRAGVHVPTYRSWQMMKNRCLNPRATDFSYYGARGILVDTRWHKFDEFVSDMGERPPGTTLERINGDLSYCKSNCCWATRLEQARNRDYTLNLAHDGRSQKVWEWAEELRINAPSLHLRLWRFKRGEISYDDVFKPNPRAK